MFIKRKKPTTLPCFKKLGDNSYISPDLVYAGEENISIGCHTSVGIRCIFFAAKADLTIGNYVIFGPNITIVTGDHRIDFVGEYMSNITNEMKLPENDQPVTIEDDVWIGTGAIILKGVTIGEGSVIAAGALVNIDVPPYTVYINNEKSKPRFTAEQIQNHKLLLAQKSKSK